MKKVIILNLLLFTLYMGTNNLFAQVSIANKELIAKFSGEWYNKKQKRNLVINYDRENNSFIINDHTEGYSEDAYYAYPKNNKLILPAQNSDHHSSYCEISIINNQLFYECNSGLNFTDNYLKKDKFSTKMIFKKRISISSKRVTDNMVELMQFAQPYYLSRYLLHSSLCLKYRPNRFLVY